MVCRIYDLYINGDGVSGPLGVKAIVDHLNDRGIKRRGKMFYVSHVHDILQRTIYTGTHYFNRLDSKTREIKPREEWIPVDVPPIIEQVVFDKGAEDIGSQASPKHTATGGQRGQLCFRVS